MLLGKAKLNTIEVLISMSLINSYSSHDKFVSVNDALKAYNEMKEEINNFCGIYYLNMVDLSKKTNERNDRNKSR